MKELVGLIIDNDINESEMFSFYLKRSGYQVKIARDEEYAINLFKLIKPSLVIFDIDISGDSGLALCKYMRDQSDCVIIVISGTKEVEEEISYLNVGADDYIVKPFEINKIRARVNAILRRMNGHKSNVSQVEYDKLLVDIKGYRVIIDGKEVRMPPREVELLFFLSSRPNKVFTRDKLLDELWGIECYVDVRTVDVHIKRLRKRLRGVSDKWELKTVWGVGYEFEIY